MTKFIFNTNESSSTTYDGISGERYVIYGKNAFEVSNSKDIEYFKSKNQFTQVGILTPKPEPKKDIDTLLGDKLDKAKVKKSTKEKIMKSYISEKELKEDIEEGYNLDPNISKSEIKKVKSLFSNKKTNKTKRKTR